MTPCPPVCPLKTSPCVRSKRPHVYRHHAHMLKHMCAWCPYTRGRFECTPGDVFESTHRFFHVCSACRNTHRQTKHTPRPPTTPRPQRHTPHNTTHNITRRQRDRERETETERDKTRRQEKMKEDRRDKTREERREKIKDKRRENREKGRREKQDKRREKMEKREKMKEKRRDKMKKKREDESENESENKERSRWKGMKEKFFFFEKCLRTLKPARWITPTCLEKESLSDELFLHFSSNVMNLTVFSIITWFEFDFFGPEELFQNGLGTA